MQHGLTFYLRRALKIIFSGILLSSVLIYQACDKDDPKPVNEEEVITTVKIILAPDAGGDVVTLAFADADGPLGNADPIISATGPLKAVTTYTAVMELSNDTVNPPVNVSEEIAGEASDHLFCFDVGGDITITYKDQDENGKPLGLITSWATGSAGDAEVVVTLRHQVGTKTGACPGVGETDVEISFPVVVSE